MQKTGSKMRGNQRGFSLVELAIVLGVASILFAGLWRLMSSGNTQMRDQTAADQQQELITSVKDYLASTKGQNFLVGLAADATSDLVLPAAAAACDAGDFCNYIPPGMSNASTNSYGQTYLIRVKKDATAAGSAPTTYSFMIVTSGGETIPDTSGGRVSSIIGGDGGFIYTANVCGANMACGSYGSWALAPIADFGFGAAPAGHIASRTYVSGGASENPWLARLKVQSPDLGGGIFDYNTIQTNISVGGNILYGSASGTPAGALLDFETITASTTDDTHTVLDIRSSSSNKMGNAPVMITRDGCDENSVYPADKNLGAVTCGYSLQVNGGQSVSGLLVASRLYATQFIYDSVSDSRLKSDVKPIDSALDKLSDLRGYSFYIKNEKGRKYGVIAQDVEKVFPELVLSLGEKDYKGVDYMGLIGPIIAALRELKEQNAALKEELSVLKASIASDEGK
ncbi:MAG: tail fiber domain-containing protein [Bdellovibrionales bacterium]